MSILTVQLSARYVYFLALDEGKVAILLPVLPPMTDTDDYSYEQFLLGFETLILGNNALDEDAYVGVITIEHVHVRYCFSALIPLLRACAKSEYVTIVPYCPYEGIPDTALHGEDIKVIAQIQSENSI